MPEVVFKGDVNSDIANKVKDYFKGIPLHTEDAVIVLIDAIVEDINGEKRPFVEIKGSIDVPDIDLIKIANHFNQIIDVSVTFGWGPMLFREEGEGFDDNAIHDARCAIIDATRLYNRS